MARVQTCRANGPPIIEYDMLLKSLAPNLFVPSMTKKPWPTRQTPHICAKCGATWYTSFADRRLAKSPKWCECKK